MKQQAKSDILNQLLSGVVEIKPGGSEALEKLIKEATEEGRQLRVKLGIDPTSTDLHLGHMVCIQKLKQFQDAGHLPVLIIGGYTAQVGDPSGRNEARPPLSAEDVQKNAQTYLDQVGKVLDLSKAELVNNADWFNKFSMADFLKLASRVTVNQMVAKEAFGTRIEKGLPLYMHETVYPLLQGFDSVEVEADIELGGTDQTFNLLVGRDLQKAHEKKQQLAMTMPLLIGLDGSKKMSKTSNNFIALNDSANEMFGKTMSIPDELIADYYSLAAMAASDEVENISAKLQDDNINPRDLKVELAKRIIEIYYNKEDAQKAEENFINQFKKNLIPDDISEYKLGEPVQLKKIMLDCGMAESAGEAKRLVKNGGVKLDGQKLDDANQEIALQGQSQVLQVGKRKFVRLVN